MPLAAAIYLAAILKSLLSAGTSSVFLITSHLRMLAPASSSISEFDATRFLHSKQNLLAHHLCNAMMSSEPHPSWRNMGRLAHYLMLPGKIIPPLEMAVPCVLKNTLRMAAHI